MDNAKLRALTILRDKSTPMTDFRKAAHQLALVLAHEAADYVATKKVPVATPLGTTEGIVWQRPIVLAPILRSGITMLPAFLEYFEEASIAVIGIKRDEKTAEPHPYYCNVPPLTHDHQIIMLDPMLATGGTSCDAIGMLIEKGAAQEHILFVSMVSAPEGVADVRKMYPKVTMLIAAEDKELSPKKFIIPGLGDFGDRFFGTV